MSFRNLAVVALLSSTVMAPSLFSQEERDLERQVSALQDRLHDINRRQIELEESNRRLSRENVELREMVEKDSGPDALLETRINALVSEIQGSATAVMSHANPITISGEARIRAGFTSNRDFGAQLADNDFEDDRGTFIDARFNLAFDFRVSENIHTRFEVIATGLFDNGTSDPNTGNLDEVNLYQGYIQHDNVFGRKEIGIKVGRQEITLGNEFHFGNNEFFGGETFDSTVAWWSEADFTLALAWTKLATNNNYNPANHPYSPFGVGDGFDDDEFYAAYLTITAIQDTVVELYYVYWNGHRGTSMGTGGNFIGAGSDIFAHVFGGRLAGTLDVAEGFDYNAEVSYMTGDLPDIAGVDVGGLTAEVTLGLTLNEQNLFRIFASFLYASGFDGDDSGWVPLFVERHAQADWNDHTKYIARWGLMDIIPFANVIAVQAGFTFRPQDDWILGATFLYAWHEEDVTTVSGGSGDDVGFEIDLFAEHRVSDTATVSAGFGLFFPDEGANFSDGFIGDSFASGNEDSVAVLFYLQSRVTF